MFPRARWRWSVGDGGNWRACSQPRPFCRRKNFHGKVYETGERRSAMQRVLRAQRRCGRREESKRSIWADSHESLNRCFTVAFCFACFIEQRADIHVNLALLQSARTSGGYTDLSSLPAAAPARPIALSRSYYPFSFRSLRVSSSAIPSESLALYHFS